MDASLAPETRHCGGTPRGVISLPVLSDAGGSGGGGGDGGGKRTIRKSKMGPWRAAVLIGVYVLFAIHLALWFISGMRDGVRETLSPVEPSESMYSIEGGLVNAGFIFFALAILSTFIFGRFFCGWGCHVVALQDLCSWMMKKCGVHPKPFRSRLLVFVPLIVALYMFVWPTFKRVVLFQWIVGGDAQRWNEHWGVYLGQSAVFPGWTNHMVVEDFWKTFAAWYMAIPFLFICTFGVVYFLGSKAFCTYGCPYGGFFAPVDIVAPGRIRVTDACEGCGHCTAVCTSNVRVHEEVRDYGMVVDPGCMKCMDCVSVCPNDALYFGFGKPALGARPRTPEAVERRRAPRRYDLSWPMEVVLALVFLMLTLGFRGMFNGVPLLMALGMAGIGTYFAWKLLTLVTEKNSRIHGFQLKLKGRLRPVGYVFVPVALVMLASGAWAGAVKGVRWRAELTAAEVAVPTEQLLTPGFRADEASRALASRAVRLYTMGGPIGDGGWGWTLRPDELQTIAYQQLVLGDLAAAERAVMEIMRRGKPVDSLVQQLGTIMTIQGATEQQVVARYEEILAMQPRLHQIRAILATRMARAGRIDDAERMYESALATLPGDAIVRKDYGMLLVQLQKAERGMALLAEAAEISAGDREGMRVRRNPETLRQVGRVYLAIGKPELALPIFERCEAMREPERPDGILIDVANAQFFGKMHEEALATMRRAVDEDPDNAAPVMSLAQMYDALNRPVEARRWAERAQEIQRRHAERLRGAGGR